MFLLSLDPIVGVHGTDLDHASPLLLQSVVLDVALALSLFCGMNDHPE